MSDGLPNTSNAQNSVSDTPKTIPPPAAVLGFGGLIPFAVPAAALWFVSSQYQFELATALVAYGAVILSFLGGIRWGLSVHPAHPQSGWSELTFSVVPSLIGWVALLVHWLVNQPLALVLLIIGFLLQYYRDRQALQHGLITRWFARLRFFLSCGATLSLLAGLIRLMTT